MLVFAVLFYLFLFSKYTILKRIIRYFVDTEKQSRFSDEFTMMYLVKQDSLEIEGDSFVRENIKIILAFLGLMNIRREQELWKNQK